MESENGGFMEPELKPCPFCGSHAKTMYVPFDDHGHVIHIFRVYCFFSRCAVIERRNLDKDAAKSEAIKRWNNRVYPPEVQAAIKIAKTAPFSITEE